MTIAWLADELERIGSSWPMRSARGRLLLSCVPLSSLGPGTFLPNVLINKWSVWVRVEKADKTLIEVPTSTIYTSKRRWEDRWWHSRSNHKSNCCCFVEEGAQLNDTVGKIFFNYSSFITYLKLIFYNLFSYRFVISRLNPCKLLLCATTLPNFHWHLGSLHLWWSTDYSTNLELGGLHPI